MQPGIMVFIPTCIYGIQRRTGTPMTGRKTRYVPVADFAPSLIQSRFGLGQVRRADHHTWPCGHRLFLRRSAPGLMPAAELSQTPSPRSMSNCVERLLLHEWQK